MILDVEELQLKDVQEAAQLIDRSFSESVAQTLTEEGISTFRRGLTPESMKQRLSSGNIFIVCKSQTAIVGVAEVRDKCHLNLLFVEPSLQRSGIGRQLLTNLLDRIHENEITVNSSLNSITAYTQYGFQKSGPKNKIRGIPYQPMVYRIEQQT